MQALLSAISGPVRGYDRLEELEARSVLDVVSHESLPL